MPIYEFACVKCGEVFEELFRSASEKRQLKCPSCGSAKVSREPSRFGIQSSSSGDSCESCSSSSCSSCSVKR